MIINKSIIPENTENKTGIVVIAGPTAVGKTAFALHAASRFSGEIISCDSMQIYRGMDIGTAKPTEEDMRGIPHHMIDIADPGESFSAAMYAEKAMEAIQTVSARGNLPIVCGGTGLYLDGIIYEMDYGNVPEDPQIRQYYTEMAEKSGPLALHEELKRKDPAAAEEIHPNNIKRMIRALERLGSGENKLRQYRGGRVADPRVEPLMIGLQMPRAELYDRINRRVDSMIEKGLVDEVKGLREMGYDLDDISMLGIGYKEIFEYLDGNIGLDEAVERIKTGTRHYAKRQFTWFRRYDNMNWIDISDYNSEDEAMSAMDGIILDWIGR